MTSIHTHPHPLAQKYVRPNNTAIASKFGIVRIEDWDDRIGGDTWMDRHARGGDKAADSYAMSGNPVPPSSKSLISEVVRCHTQSTGELVLLHNDWVKDGQVIA
jgi:hypothetical protein